MTEPSRHIIALAAEHTRSLAECHIACWREAYQDIVPAHVLAAFDVERRAELWERTRTKYPGSTHVAVVDGDVIGFAGVGPSHDKSPATSLELKAMYVRAQWYGTGVAHDLIRATLDPATPCSLWVFEANARARSFYRKHGFELDGARRVEDFTAATAVRMVRGADT